MYIKQVYLDSMTYICKKVKILIQLKGASKIKF